MDGTDALLRLQPCFDADSVTRRGRDADGDGPPGWRDWRTFVTFRIISCMSWGGDIDAMKHLADRLDGAARQLSQVARLAGSVVVDDGAACVVPGATGLSVLADTAA